jgi:hypothetical protein
MVRPLLQSLTATGSAGQERCPEQADAKQEQQRSYPMETSQA